MADPIFFGESCVLTQDEPPVGHAAHHWDEATRTLRYEYNGRSIIALTVPAGVEFGYRHGSDGDLQSVPFVQQLYFSLSEPAKVTVTFRLSGEAVCMRPQRAGAEQAIFGQVGAPLVFGVNGLYDIRQDLLLSWHGCAWRWLSDGMVRDAQGDLLAEVEVEMGPMVWFLNLQPHYYRQHLGYGYHEPWRFRPDPRPIAGWCSWEAYRRSVSEAHITEVSAFFAETLKPYGLEYIQIDDGYEPTPIPANPAGSIAENWLTTNDQFPHGHAGAIDAITAQGLTPGIWVSASLTNDDFSLYHADEIITDADGVPVKGDWLGYVLDCEPETLQTHVFPYYRKLRELGYRYFKTDQIRHLFIDGLQKAVRQGILSNADAERRFRAYMECTREGMGPDAFCLSSWGVLSQVVGVADACRISMDANPTWAGVRMQIVEQARWYHAQRILFINDPDHICARAKLEWTRSIISLFSLTGGLFMLSDPLEAYDAERVRLLQQCLPPLTTTTGETGPLPLDSAAYTWTKLHGFAVKRDTPVAAEDVELSEALQMAGEFPTMHDDHPFSTLWAVRLGESGRRWTVVGRFATTPLRASALALAHVGLDPVGSYHVFDFWAQQYRGRVSGAIPVEALPLGHCQLLGVRAVLEHPQFLASSRHISMDAVSVQDERWADDTLTLELTGVQDTEETYWIWLPEGWALRAVAAEQVTVVAEAQGELLPVRVRFDRPDGTVRVRFTRV
ncbi:MAG TPA: alpha-galactosidase [Armatimonadota bacterium]